jgi:hypothetical protein
VALGSASADGDDCGDLERREKQREGRRARDTWKETGVCVREDHCSREREREREREERETNQYSDRYMNRKREREREREREKREEEATPTNPPNWRA